MSHKKWDWVEVSIEELGKYRAFGDVTQRFRGSDPVGLITKLDGLRDFVALNLLAPVNSAFWSVARYSVFSGVYEHLVRSGCKQNDKKKFIKDLRAAGIKLTDPAIRLFDLYTSFFPSSTNKVPGFSHDGISTPEACRLVSTGCHISLLPKLLSHFEREIENYDRFSFFVLDEILSLGSPLHYDKLNLSAYMFRLWQPHPDMTDEERQRWRLGIIAELEYAVDKVSAGEAMDRPIEPIIIIRPCPSFALRGQESSLKSREIDNPEARKIISLRARLIRLLAWPIFYDDVVSVLSTDANIHSIDAYGEFEPYDVKSELETYKENMEDRYPCLLEQPYTGSKIVSA